MKRKPPPLPPMPDRKWVDAQREIIIVELNTLWEDCRRACGDHLSNEHTFGTLLDWLVTIARQNDTTTDDILFELRAKLDQVAEGDA
jgi:hypothetical protein